MGEGTPNEVVTVFGEALRAGDAITACSLLSREACLVTPDATVIQGRAGVLGFLEQLVQMTGEMTIEQRTMLTAGDVAVGSESWGLRVGGEAAPLRRTSRATLILRRAEGAWRIAVVDPWRG